MQPKAFIEDMNALVAELNTLPPTVAGMIVTLMDLVDVQNSSIQTLLAANKKLLGVIDRMRE